MTISKNDLPDNRTTEDNLYTEKQIVGFKDPSGSNPKHVSESSVNRAARNRSRNELDLGGSVPNSTSVSSEYPYNDVNETPSGHVIEIDDTPGGARILIKHNSGSGIELRPDGSVVIKSEQNQITVVNGTSTVIVEGDADVQYKGNLNFSVTGDLNFDIGGNMTTSVKGNNIKTTHGSDRENVYGTKSSVAKGDRSSLTLGVQTDTNLNAVNTSIKGNETKAIEGNSSIGASGNLKITSESEVILSSTNINIGASNLSVFGSSGTIGGAGIVMYSLTNYATSFYGDLIGIAKEAVVANGALVPTDNGTTTAEPTASILSSYLEQSTNGVSIITIDTGDYLKSTVDQSSTFGGVTDRPLTVGETRIKLRDTANSGNSAFVGNSVSTGVLSETYVRTVPSEINRVSGPDGTTVIPVNSIGAGSATRVKPSKNLNMSKFIVDPNYDPNKFVGKITGALQLASNISLSRFIGGNLDHISTTNEKLDIARRLSMQVPLLKSILHNQGQFKNNRLIISAGLYKTSPTEILTSKSTNDLATKGYVVTYELYDSKNTLDLEKTYDLAIYWKNSFLYDSLELAYDTFDKGNLHAQIIVTMPEIDSKYNLVNGKYGNRIKTTFNNNLQGNDLIEVISA